MGWHQVKRLLGNIVEALLSPLSYKGHPWEQPVTPDTVFCLLCRDWHPPDNCAGDWP
jgi:hypothetical protein